MGTDRGAADPGTRPELIALGVVTVLAVTGSLVWSNWSTEQPAQNVFLLWWAVAALVIASAGAIAHHGQQKPAAVLTAAAHASAGFLLGATVVTLMSPDPGMDESLLNMVPPLLIAYVGLVRELWKRRAADVPARAGEVAHAGRGRA